MRGLIFSLAAASSVFLSAKTPVAVPKVTATFSYQTLRILAALVARFLAISKNPAASVAKNLHTTPASIVHNSTNMYGTSFDFEFYTKSDIFYSVLKMY